MSLLKQVTTYLAIANCLLLTALLYVYGKNLLKVRTSFTAGLTLFIVLFLVENLVSLYFYSTNMPYYAAAVETHVFLLSLLQTVAFAIMNWISWK